MRFCTNCGAPIAAEGKKFCTKCGTPVQAEPSEAETQVAPTTALPPLAPQSPATPQSPVTPESPAAPPAGADAERPTYVAPPGSWPPSQPGPPGGADEPLGSGADEPRSYVSPPGSWPPSQGPGYDSAQWLRSGPAAQDYGPGPPGPPGPSRPGHAAAWIGFAVVVALVLAGGAFAAWKFLGHHTTNHPAAGSTGSPNQAGSGPGPGSSPTPAASTPAAPPTPSAAGGTFTVALAPAVAGQPGEQQVVSFLQSYFTAINDHNYGQYAPLLAPSQRPTATQFNGGYGSTADSAATLTGISPTGNGVAATVKFTSHQSPSQSPTGTGCDSWHITLYLQSHAGGYRIGPAAPGYHAHYRAC